MDGNENWFLVVDKLLLLLLLLRLVLYFGGRFGRNAFDGEVMRSMVGMRRGFMVLV